MLKFNWSVVKSLEYISYKRPECNPKPYFIKQLEKCNKVSEAETEKESTIELRWCTKVTNEYELVIRNTVRTTKNCDFRFLLNWCVCVMQIVLEWSYNCFRRGISNKISNIFQLILCVYSCQITAPSRLKQPHGFGTHFVKNVEGSPLSRSKGGYTFGNETKIPNQAQKNLAPIDQTLRPKKSILKNGGKTDPSPCLHLGLSIERVHSGDDSSKNNNSKATSVDDIKNLLRLPITSQFVGYSERWLLFLIFFSCIMNTLKPKKKLRVYVCLTIATLFLGSQSIDKAGTLLANLTLKNNATSKNRYQKEALIRDENKYEPPMVSEEKLFPDVCFIITISLFFFKKHPWPNNSWSGFQMPRKARDLSTTNSNLIGNKGAQFHRAEKGSAAIEKNYGFSQTDINVGYEIASVGNLTKQRPVSTSPILKNELLDSKKNKTKDQKESVVKLHSLSIHNIASIPIESSVSSSRKRSPHALNAGDADAITQNFGLEKLQKNSSDDMLADKHKSISTMNSRSINDRQINIFSIKKPRHSNKFSFVVFLPKKIGQNPPRKLPRDLKLGKTTLRPLDLSNLCIQNKDQAAPNCIVIVEKKPIILIITFIQLPDVFGNCFSFQIQNSQFAKILRSNNHNLFVEKKRNIHVKMYCKN
ncbi:hypothetical protein RFI_05238 [Reticulomyxa filosa]|uniref:Uncharacterized protein n=1 Tax=Reticulomyxa filosa TaxID=46433 RepID=X6P1E6_RETFI|nr:hypothetical protein RFI_05238 [Reticulomyxa filosa]|eukprot:ETO31879.1 hypothetical protein RFI_05238 [Reticulomyxa filosa]